MIWLRIGLIGALLAVVAGAFGAHAVKPRVDADRLHVFEVAAQQQMAHSLALVLLLPLTPWLRSRRWINTAGACFLAGIALFCGSLYAYVLSGQRSFTMAAPAGGLAFITGWAVLACAALARGRGPAREL